MDRRNFLKQASGYALAAAGTMTGIGQVFASTISAKEDRTNGHSDNLKQSKDMEHRNLGGMEVSAIGLGCLPMVGYYGGKYEKKDMITLIRRAHAVCPLSAVQSEYAIWWREPETKIFPTLQELEIGFVPYCPLGRAFLTGTINENRRLHKGDRSWNLPQFQTEALKHNMPLVHIVEKWAKRKGVTPAQFALIWMLSRKPWIAPIPGTTNPDHLDDFLGAASVRLTPYEMEEFDADYAKIDLMGHRADPFPESQIDK